MLDAVDAAARREHHSNEQWHDPETRGEIVFLMHFGVLYPRRGKL